MKQENIISGRTEEEVWKQINAQFLANPDPLEEKFFLKNH